MKRAQDKYSCLLQVLTEIKQELIDCRKYISNKTINDLKDNKTVESNEAILLSQLRLAFFHQLEAKTGWGRNEIKDIFDSSISSVL